MSKIKMSQAGAVLVCFLLMCHHNGETTSYNSSTACFKGSEQTRSYSATCVGEGATAIIAVNRVLYGLQPDANICQDTDPASVCCSYTPNQDCFFANKPGQLPTDVVEGCSGQTECTITAKQKFKGTSCPLPELFQRSSFTTYGFIEYKCISVNLLTDICHDGIIDNKRELYIDSNIYHTNTEHNDTSCTCRLTTSCGAAIIFEAVDIRLRKVSGSDICKEELHLIDDNKADTNATVTCLDRDLNAFTEVFTSQTNSVTLNLTIDGKHEGKLWVKVKATWLNATVQLQCGSSYEQVGHPDHVCPEDVTTTPATGRISCLDKLFKSHHKNYQQSLLKVFNDPEGDHDSFQRHFTDTVHLRHQRFFVRIVIYCNSLFINYRKKRRVLTIKGFVEFYCR